MNSRTRHTLAVLALILLPIILLAPCLFGDRTYVPWDIAQFPPAQTLMTPAEHAKVTENNNTDVTEIPVMFLPELEFICDEIEQGRMPHWNPYARSGTNVWASSILGIWYPLNWLILLVDDPAHALDVGAFLALIIATLLMYGLLIHLGLSIPGAIFGALAFGMSGTLTVNLHFYQRINALIWLPGILWAISAIGKREGHARIPAMLGLAGCFFMCHTAGFPPYALVVTLVGVGFTALALAHRLRRGVRETLHLAMAIGVAATIGVVMASVQSVPMFEFFPESNRTMEASGNSLAEGGFDPAGLLGYLCPTLFTHPHINSTGGLPDQFSPLFWFLYSRASWDTAGAFPAGTVFQPKSLNFCEYTVFLGTPTLLLAVAGLCSRGPRLRFAALFALLFLFALAFAPPWFRYVLEVPPFRWVPPTRYTGAACLFLAMLAACGVHALPTLQDGLRRALWIFGFALGVIALGLAGWVHLSFDTPESFLAAMAPTIDAKYAGLFPDVPEGGFPDMIRQYLGPNAAGARSQLLENLLLSGTALILSGLVFLLLPRFRRGRGGASTAQILVLVLAGIELLYFAVPLNTGRVLAGRPLNETPVHEFLRSKRDEHRETGGFAVMRAHTSKVEYAEPKQLPPDLLLNEHIRDIHAYTFVDKWSHKPILALYGPEQLLRKAWPRSFKDDDRLTLPYWDMLGVRFVLTEHELTHAGKQVGPILSGPKGIDPPTMFFGIYERPNPLPRAWVVHDVREPPKNEKRPTADPELDMVEALISRDFRPADIAYVDESTADALRAVATKPGAKGNARVVRFPLTHETSSLTIEVAAGDPGFLVVNDTAMGGWTAELTFADGRTEPAVIHRANLFQRLLVLPADRVTVAFRYTTPGFTLGLGLSAAGGIAFLALLVFGITSRRRRRSAEVPS